MRPMKVMLILLVLAWSGTAQATAIVLLCSTSWSVCATGGSTNGGAPAAGDTIDLKTFTLTLDGGTASTHSCTKISTTSSGYIVLPAGTVTCNTTTLSAGTVTLITVAAQTFTATGTINGGNGAAGITISNASAIVTLGTVTGGSDTTAGLGCSMTAGSATITNVNGGSKVASHGISITGGTLSAVNATANVSVNSSGISISANTPKVTVTGTCTGGAHSSAGSSGENSYKSNLSENSIMSGDSKISDIEVSFEITQVLISRPWFYPEFFMNRGWTLRKGDGWELDMPSDGNIPEPNGTFIAYPTAALFVRNVTIKSKEIASAYKAYKERKASLSIGSQSSSAHSNESGSAHSSESGSAHSSESGSAHSGESGSAQSSESDRSSRGGKVGANYGIGCFSIGGGYSSSSSNEHSSGSSDAHNSGSSDAHNSGSSDAHNSGSSNAHGSGHSEDHSSNLSSAGRESLQGAQWESTVNGDTITIPGMQIVGFICQFFGKAPNPDPELKDTDFS